MTANDEEIVALLDSYESESKAIKHELLKMCWFMRGGLTFEEAMALSITERETIARIIEDNLEVTKKSGMSFF